ncbi:MAG: hypothetical protein UX98_C0012G0026 [Parcubacteria group bacterium GW2011_GWA2_47_26]|nr:MAG: hypothetical protein UX98_C0012G0026 [Parcubacteria group bacterium GW2011_GWA2_47_26]
MRSLISITVLFFFGVFGCGGGDRAAPPDAGAPDLVEPDRETPDTYVASCGNGVRDPGEECDDGSRNSNSAPDACRTSCRLASCGDGVRDSREQCDQGQRNSNTEPDACRMNCALARCGDNVRDASEQCEGEASQSCAPACGSTGVQRCLNCVWDSCIATDDVCDDGNPCTVADSCLGNACMGTPMTCTTPPTATCLDDVTLRTYAATGNLCTDDSCDPARGCVFTPNTLACNDGNLCTVADTCSGGSCAGTPMTCATPPSAVCVDDATLRTYAATGACSAGVCNYTVTDTTCNDSNACTADSCVSGVCVYTPITCTTPPVAVCADDATLRTYAETGMCAGGVCSYTLTDTTCNDSNACTTDSCLAGMCMTAPITCTTPPLAVCVSGTVRRTYAATGESLHGRFLRSGSGLCVHSEHSGLQRRQPLHGGGPVRKWLVHGHAYGLHYATSGNVSG